MDNVKSSSTGGVDAWDTSKYLNIWVCNIEDSFLGQVLGFAYPPTNVNEVLENELSTRYLENLDIYNQIINNPLNNPNLPIIYVRFI